MTRKNSNSACVG